MCEIKPEVLPISVVTASLHFSQMTHTDERQKTNPGKTSQKQLDDTVSNKPDDTARKTTWRHSQKNNMATRPEKQPGDTARKTTW